MSIDRPIAIVITLFITLLLGFFLVAPEYNTFKSLQLQLGEKQAEYNAKFDYYGQITKTYFELQSRKDDIKKIDNALPTGPSLGNDIYYLQNTATGNGMLIKDLFLSKSGSNKSSNTVGSTTFSMDALGSYSSLENFLISLQNSARIFEVTSISFGSSSASSPASSSPAPVGKSQLQSQTQSSQVQQTYSFSLQINAHSY